MAERKRKIEVKDERWSSTEFRSVDFGDVRLTKRLIDLTYELSQSPQAPINQATEDSSSMKAAYRFFSNPKVSGDKILHPHIENTIKRASGEETVLCIQDTSYLDFRGHKKTEGLGLIGSHENYKGLLLHTGFACSTTGIPLGLLFQKCWARRGNTRGKTREEISRLEIWDKENHKWLETSRAVGKLKTNSKVVHVADRECDFYEFFTDCEQQKNDYLVRVKFDRIAFNSKQERIGKLYQLLAKQPVVAEIETTKPGSKKENEIKLECRCGVFKFKTPDKVKNPEREYIEHTFIQVKEIPSSESPGDKEPIEWILATNIACDTPEEVIEKISWYKLRWRIEEYHKILKSGCNIEKCRLETVDRLVNFIALKSVIAWRIFWLTHINRVSPKADASTVLTQNEINTLKSLRRFKDYFAKKRKITVRHVIVAIGMLGGYINRKNDPPPGNIYIWRGIKTLSNMTEAYEGIMENISTCG